MCEVDTEVDAEQEKVASGKQKIYSSVFCRQISTNPGLNVNLGFCFFFKSIFLVIFSVLLRNIQSSNCRQNEFNRITL